MKWHLNSRAVLCLAFVSCFWVAWSAGAAPPTEAQLIKDLSSHLPLTVISALKELEQRFPASAPAQVAVKKLLSDKRSGVRRKAARVLATMHAEVDETGLKAIYSMLKSPNGNEVEDALLALGGLGARPAIPEILPFLKHSNTHLVRDACRALAGLGDQGAIPAIEPLLNHSELAVRKDATNAINRLKVVP